MQVELEAVRPDGAGKAEEEEYRLSVALLPLRLRVDQNMVTFLQAFFTSPDRGNNGGTNEDRMVSSSPAEGRIPFFRVFQGFAGTRLQYSDPNMNMVKTNLSRLIIAYNDF